MVGEKYNFDPQKKINLYSGIISVSKLQINSWGKGSNDYYGY